MQFCHSLLPHIGTYCTSLYFLLFILFHNLGIQLFLITTSHWNEFVLNKQRCSPNQSILRSLRMGTKYPLQYLKWQFLQSLLWQIAFEVDDSKGSSPDSHLRVYSKTRPHSMWSIEKIQQLWKSVLLLTLNMQVFSNQANLHVG